MESKLELKSITLSVGITAAIIYAICAIAYAVLPKSTFDTLWKPMFHWFFRATATNLVLGLLEVIIYSVAIAAIFVGVYNRLQEKKG